MIAINVNILSIEKSVNKAKITRDLPFNLYYAVDLYY